jgi:hypothetical protein
MFGDVCALWIRAVPVSIEGLIWMGLTASTSKVGLFFFFLWHAMPCAIYFVDGGGRYEALQAELQELDVCDAHEFTI